MMGHATPAKLHYSSAALSWRMLEPAVWDALAAEDLSAGIWRSHVLSLYGVRKAEPCRSILARLWASQAGATRATPPSADPGKASSPPSQAFSFDRRAAHRVALVGRRGAFLAETFVSTDCPFGFRRGCRMDPSRVVQSFIHQADG